MEEKIKKSKKIENIMTVLLVILIILFAFVVIIVVTNKDRMVVEEEIPVIDENTYISVENIENTEYLTIYESANIKRVNFINMPEVLVSNFYKKQDEFISTLNNNITTNKDFIDEYNVNNNITDYTVKSKLDSIVLYDLKDNILSLLYLIEDKVDYIGITNYITNIFVDVSTNSLVNTDTLIDTFNLSKEEISLEIFNIIVNEHADKFIDKDTNKELTMEEILTNQEMYINKLVDNFDSYIYLYFNEEEIYLKYNKNDISNLLFNENLETIKYSTLKLEN